MLRRFLVLILLASVLFVLANTVAHASPAIHVYSPKLLKAESIQNLPAKNLPHQKATHRVFSL